MRALLDTHILLWWLAGDSRLTEPQHRVLRDPANQIMLSAVCALEMAIKASLGKLTLPVAVGTLIADVLAEDGFRELPISLLHAAEVQRLPDHHRDPFDRLLVAQARVEGLALISSDPQVARYEVEVIS